MTTHDDHGPGVTWLAQQAGVTPGELLRDGRVLARALQQATHVATDLARRLGSDDPVVRQQAEREADAVRARLLAPGVPTPAERFGQRVAAGLRDAAERLRE